MSSLNHTTLRERLIARNGGPAAEPNIIEVASIGQIDEFTVHRLQHLAVAARRGDVAARDLLYRSLQNRLHRIGWVLRPWPDTADETGIWERDDVRQESWLVFVDLLRAWNEEGSFVAYLLARFAWRLRDRILRGIGKSKRHFGHRVPEEVMARSIYAPEFEEPEPAFLASLMLDEWMQSLAQDDSAGAVALAFLRLVDSARPPALVTALASPPSRETPAKAA